MRKSAWSVATCLETSARTVAAAGAAVRAKERKRMSKCVERLSLSTKPTESSETDQNIFIGIRIRLPRSKSGPAIALTAKIFQDRIMRMVVRSLSSKGVNPGVEVTADATVYLFNRHDCEPIRFEPISWLAV